MPSITPASFGYTGGTLRTSRLAPARLTFTGGTFTAGHESPTTTAAVVPTLDRLTVYDKFPGVGDAEWHRFVAIWQDKCEKIEEAFAFVSEIAHTMRREHDRGGGNFTTEQVEFAERIAEMIGLASLEKKE